MNTSAGLFEIDREGSTIIVTPVTDLRELNYRQIEDATDALLAFLDDPMIHNVVVDFARTDYFGSTALGCFLRVGAQVPAATPRPRGGGPRGGAGSGGRRASAAAAPGRSGPSCPAAVGTWPPPGSRGRRGWSRRTPFFPPLRGGFPGLGADAVDGVADPALGRPEQLAVGFAGRQSGQVAQAGVGDAPEDFVDALGLGRLLRGAGRTRQVSPPGGVDFDLPPIVRPAHSKIHQLSRRSPTPDSRVSFLLRAVRPARRVLKVCRPDLGRASPHAPAHSRHSHGPLRFILQAEEASRPPGAAARDALRGD
jgi:hypothetical protein